MKKVMYIMVILVGSILTGCNKDETSKPIFEFNKNTIKQTGWKGTLRINFKDETSEEEISMLFLDDKVGRYEYKKTQTGGFDYDIDGKLLRIWGLQSNKLEGDWMLVEFTENKLILKDELYSEQYNKTLELTRDY
ncbi:hypothetical protein [Sphingobacterium sp. DR205]|uniref:hypothetical protein n=1 Tax=Sphingobacterium sp. DR205 TaxID=2713573 RepID=UPI0013E433DB|nr:hypothetical protein [Sphingobacterium sp. DR205]QIH31502.1 hypothetical protein G6053_00625 [Sphingobacterium sp. DR205]